MAFDINKFNDPDAPENEDAVKFIDPELQEAEDKEPVSTIQAAAAGFKRPVEEFVEGTLQMGLKGAQKLGIPTEGPQRVLKGIREERIAELGSAREEAPVATTGGQILGTLGLGAAIPGGVAGKLGQRVLSGAAAGGLLAGGQYTEEGESRLANTLQGAALGGSMVGLMAAGKGLLRLGKRFVPGRREAALGIKSQLGREGLERGEEVAQVAQKQGTFVTPGEAAGNIPLKVQEARLPVTEVQQGRITKALAERGKILKTKTLGLIDDIVPEGDRPAQEAAEGLYQKVRDIAVPKAKMNELLDDPILSKNLAKALQDVDYRMDKFEPNSIGRLNEFKKFLDHKISRGKFEGSVNRNLLNARGKLVSALDEAAPDYAQARKISQRIIMKRDYLREMGDIKLEPGQKEPTVGQIYGKLFGNKNKQQEFFDNVELSGGSVTQAKDVIKLLNAVDKTKISKLLTKDLSLKTVQFGGDVSTRVAEKGWKALQGRYNDALLDISMNPKWASELKSITKASDKKIAERFGALLGKVMAQEME